MLRAVPKCTVSDISRNPTKKGADCVNFQKKNRLVRGLDQYVATDPITLRGGLIYVFSFFL